MGTAIVRFKSQSNEMNCHYACTAEIHPYPCSQHGHSSYKSKISIPPLTTSCFSCFEALSNLDCQVVLCISASFLSLVSCSRKSAFSCCNRFILLLILSSGLVSLFCLLVLASWSEQLNKKKLVQKAVNVYTINKPFHAYRNKRVDDAGAWGACVHEMVVEESSRPI